MVHESLPDRHLSKLKNGKDYSSVPEEERLNSELEKLLHFYEMELEDNGKSSVLNNITVKPEIYTDKHGLPVTYDADTHNKQEKARADGLSILWHELLSPLTVIKGYTSTLLQLRDDITPEQEIQYIQGIEAASNRMIRLMENLRDITRLEEPDNLYFQRMSLPDLLRTVAHRIQKNTTNNCIKIPSYKRLPLVSADPDKIEQVIDNLLTNAVKYSPHGGDIEIEVCISRDEEEYKTAFGGIPPNKLPCFIVSIADSGIGIPEEEIDNIFERFYRGKNKMTRNAHGAGLGLYICKKIIEAHRGRIWARNRDEGGSVFYFSIPCN